MLCYDGMTFLFSCVNHVRTLKVAVDWWLLLRRFPRLDTSCLKGMTAWDLPLCRWFFWAVLTLTRYQQGGYRDQYITPAWPRDLWTAGHREDPGCVSTFLFMSFCSNDVFCWSAYWSWVAVLTILLAQLQHTIGRCPCLGLGWPLDLHDRYTGHGGGHVYHQGHEPRP